MMNQSPLPIPAEIEEIAHQVIQAAFRVHKKLGLGLLESVYERCLCYELGKAGLEYKRQLELPIHYDELALDSGLRIDILVCDLLIVELKAVEKILPVHKAQLITYLKLAEKRLGLLLNFNVPLLKEGIQRIAL